MAKVYTPTNVVLVKDNQFGKDGPQSGDRGVVVGTFHIPNIPDKWYKVAFACYLGEEFTCPEASLAFVKA